jgi:hypothetical protein
MLTARKMPQKFWGLAVLHAVYVRNRTVKPGESKTRHELMFGKKPSLKHCLPFGCPVMLHNHDPHIRKLDARAFKGIFVGFNESNHTYKIWNLESSQLIESRDIKPYPNEFVDFSDYRAVPFAVENDNNWITGEPADDLPADDQREDEEDAVQQPPIINNNNDDKDDSDEDPIDQDIFGHPVYQLNTNPINTDIIGGSADIIGGSTDIIGGSTDIIGGSTDIIGGSADIIGGSADINKINNININNANNRKTLTAEQIYEIETLDEIETPKTYKQAMKSPEKQEWKDATQRELDSLIKNHTFDVVPRPPNVKILNAGLIFKIKPKDDNKASQFKARFVAKGYAQEYGIDYFETFSPTMRHASSRFLISSAVMLGFKIHHFDVQTAFLNGELEETIYLEIPEGFEASLKVDRKAHVLKLVKSIYGLKQASRVWNQKFTSTIQQMNFVQSQADPCVFIKYGPDKLPIALIGIYVDDCHVAANEDQIVEIGNQLKSNFEMHDLGLLTYSLGINIDQSNGAVTLSQAKYVEKLTKKFGMDDSRIMSTPLPFKPQQDESNNKPFADINKYQQLIGSLIYLANATRPDLAFAVGYLARSMQKPTEANFNNAKRILRYLNSKPLALRYYDKSKIVEGYSDSSYAEEKDYKSVGGYVFLQAGAAITWRSTKQDIVAQSSAEAEYIALAEAAKEALWIRKLQQEIFPNIKVPTIIHEDNQSTINLAKNPIHTNRSKHIAVRYHATRDYVQKSFIQVKYMPTTEMIADIMTKSLGRVLHEYFVAKMGLVDPTNV